MRTSSDQHRLATPSSNRCNLFADYVARQHTAEPIEFAPAIDWESSIEPDDSDQAADVQVEHETGALSEAGHASQLDASIRFANAYHDMVKHVPGLGWLVWNSMRWSRDGADAAVMVMAKKNAREFMSTQRDYRDAKAALVLETASAIRASLSLAASDPRINLGVAQLDEDAWLLNCLNGTIDLRTGQLKAHDRRDFISKLAPVVFEPNATHATLNKYLCTIDKSFTTGELSRFLARCYGAALTGDATTESLFLLQGGGGSGKTTLTDAVAAMLGDYCAKMDFTSFCSSRHGRSPGAASPDLMMLRGARLAYASEGDQNARLDAGKVKELTGGDPITARALREAPVTFLQTWKLWLISNFDPGVDSEDGGVWRRLIKIKFDVIPEEKRDHTIKSLLATDPSARTALLAWCVRGCLDWRQRGLGRHGLAIPQSVLDETLAYKKKSDSSGEWFDELLHGGATLDPQGFSTNSFLRKHYEVFCANIGSRPLSAVKFSAYLESKGLKKTRTSAGIGWLGIQPDEVEPGYGSSYAE